MELVLPPTSLPADAQVSIQQGLQEQPDPAGLMRVSDVYDVRLPAGRVLSGTATVHLRYHTNAAARVRRASLAIYRWDETGAAWESLGGALDDAQHQLSADIDHLSTFAVFGAPGTELFVAHIER